MTSHEEDRKYMLFNVTRSSWKAVIFFSHLCQPFILNYYIWLYAMNICINIDVEAFLAISPFGQPLSCRWPNLLLVPKLVESSNPRSSIHCIQSRSSFPVFLSQWVFYSGFSYRVVYHSIDSTFCRVPYYFNVRLCRKLYYFCSFFIF